jgi:chromosome segregation ATPase
VTRIRKHDNDDDDATMDDQWHKIQSRRLSSLCICRRSTDGRDIACHLRIADFYCNSYYSSNAKKDDTMSVDAGIFQFGSSATVHDDLRRTLTGEADAINKSNIKINEDIGVETKVRNQVLKDRSHGHNEMVRLRRSSSEFMQRLGMSEQLQQGISKTLVKEVTTMLIEQDDIENRANGGCNSNSNNNNENQESIPPVARPKSIQSLKEAFQASSDETDHFLTAIAEGQNVLNEVSMELSNVEENKREVQSEFDPLNADLVKAQSVTNSYQQSLEAETQRHLSLKATLSSLETEKEQLAKEIEEMVSIAAQNKDGFDS